MCVEDNSKGMEHPIQMYDSSKIGTKTSEVQPFAFA